MDYAWEQDSVWTWKMPQIPSRPLHVVLGVDKAFVKAPVGWRLKLSSVSSGVFQVI